MGKVEFFRALSDFLSEKHGKPVTVAGDTDLLGSGLIDSLIMVEILMLIEQLTGEPVDPDMLDPEAFESGDLLYRTFIQRDAALTGR